MAITEARDIGRTTYSVYGIWQSQAVTHQIMNLTSVIEPTQMRQRRIPYRPTYIIAVNFRQASDAFGVGCLFADFSLKLNFGRLNIITYFFTELYLS